MPSRIVHPNPAYQLSPCSHRGLFELRRAADELYRRLPEVRCPARIMYATEDPIVDPYSATRILGRLGSADKMLEPISSAGHGILNEDIGDIQTRIQSYLDEWCLPPQADAAPQAIEAASPAGDANEPAQPHVPKERTKELTIGEGLEELAARSAFPIAAGPPATEKPS